jgi:hypothetical protein
MAIRMSGRIVELRGERDGTVIILDNPPNTGPLNNEWLLERNHQNYNALYSLALAAAANRWSITVRIAGSAQINFNVAAAVGHLAVGWT